MAKTLTFLAFFAFALIIDFNPAQALKLTLKRIIFEGSKRAEFIIVINDKNEEETYRLGWRNFRMTEDGLTDITDTEEIPEGIKTAQDMVRFAPRRFTIPPRSSQQVRLILRRPGDLADGEYRSHLWIQPEAKVEELKNEIIEYNKTRKSKKAEVRLSMMTGATMPVIVRKGNLSAAVSVEKLTAVRDKEDPRFIEVATTLLRDGDKSVYGDLEYVCNPDSGPYILTLIRGLAIYTETNKKNYKVRAKPQANESVPCRNVLLRYIATDGLGGDRRSVLAEMKTQVEQ